jgi:hypothetical protein
MFRGCTLSRHPDYDRTDGEDTYSMVRTVVAPSFRFWPCSIPASCGVCVDAGD